MSLAVLMHGLGSMGFFTSRAFLPAFMGAVALRWGQQWSWLADTGFAAAVGDAPHWFTSDVTIGALGVLALLELLADKSPDAKAVLLEIDGYVKPAMAGLTTLGILGATDVAFVEETLKRGDLVSLDSAFALAVAVGTWWLATLRASLLAMFVDADADDDAGVQGLMSWAEDVWAALGPWLLILYPLVMLGLLAMVSGLLWVARKRADAREEQSRVPCGSCGEPTYVCALACAQCGTEVPAPRDVSWLGRSLEAPAPDRADHPHRLAEKHRCPRCAARLDQRDPRQACPACAHPMFTDAAFRDAYVARVGARLPRVLAISFLFSLVPVLGLIPGVIYSRLQLVAPFRRHMPRGRTFVLRWIIRVIFLLLILGQLVPGVGGFAVPIMALISHQAYRSAFVAATSAPA